MNSIFFCKMERKVKIINNKANLFFLYNSGFYYSYILFCLNIYYKIKLNRTIN